MKPTQSSVALDHLSGISARVQAQTSAEPTYDKRETLLCLHLFHSTANSPFGIFQRVLWTGRARLGNRFRYLTNDPSSPLIISERLHPDCSCLLSKAIFCCESVSCFDGKIPLSDLRESSSLELWRVAPSPIFVVQAEWASHLPFYVPAVSLRQ